MKIIKKHKKAFTLVEVVVTGAIVVLVGVSILSLVVHTMYMKRFERERIVATNAAAARMEELKRILFPYLTASTTSITLDVNDTPANASDDIPATMYVKFYNKNGTLINKPPANSNDYITSRD